MQNPDIPKIGIQITTDCNLKCPHCIVSSGESIKRTMTPEKIKECIDDAAKLDVTAISFTGGEPFCHLKLLIDCTAFAAERAMIPEVVTNGMWGRNKVQRDKILDRIAKAGMRYIGLSHDVFHLPFTGTKMIVELSAAAKLRNLKTRLFVNLSRHPRNVEVLEVASLLNIPVVLTAIIPFGRARNIDRRFFLQCSSEAGVCPQAKCPFIHVDGNVTMCCGLTDLSNSDGHRPVAGILGNVYNRNLTSILSDRRLPVQFAFANHRIDELLAFCAGEHGPKMTDFRSVCEACYFILSRTHFLKQIALLYPKKVNMKKPNTIKPSVDRMNIDSSLENKILCLRRGTRLIKGIRIHNRSNHKNEGDRFLNFLCFPDKDGYMNYQILGDHILHMLEPLWSGKRCNIEDFFSSDIDSVEGRIDLCVAHLTLMELYKSGALQKDD